MQLFLLGILVSLVPSVLFLTWQIWKSIGPQRRRRIIAGPSRD